MSVRESAAREAGKTGESAGREATQAIVVEAHEEQRGDGTQQQVHDGHEGGEGGGPWDTVVHADGDGIQGDGQDVQGCR